MEFVTKSNLTKYTTYLNEYLKKCYQHLDTNGYQQQPNITGTTVGTSGNDNYLRASIPTGTTGENSPNWYYATDGSLQDISTKTVASADKLTTARTIWGQPFDGTANISGDATYLMSINNSDGDSITSINNEPSNTNHFIQFGKQNRDYVLWNEYGGIWKFSGGTNGANFLVQLGNTNYFANNIGVGTSSPSESIHTTGNVKASEYKLTDGSVYAEPCTTDDINTLFE